MELKDTYQQTSNLSMDKPITVQIDTHCLIRAGATRLERHNLPSPEINGHFAEMQSCSVYRTCFGLFTRNTIEDKCVPRLRRLQIVIVECCLTRLKVRKITTGQRARKNNDQPLQSIYLRTHHNTSGNKRARTPQWEGIKLEAIAGSHKLL